MDCAPCRPASPRQFSLPARGWRSACFCLLIAVLTAAPLLADPPPRAPAATPAAVAETPPPAQGGVFSQMQKTMQALPQSLFKVIQDGGPLMIPIIFCSVVALAFGVERMVILRRRRVIPKSFVNRFLAHLEQGTLDRVKALRLCEENGSPVAEVFAHGVRKWGKPSVEVEQAIIDGGERQVNQLRKHLRVLNSVATIAPLLGLLGTVMGMIQCFNEIANNHAMGKAKQLAGGIGIALITTAGGLSVAIPALILYMYLTGRVDALVVEMDGLSQKVVDLISAEGQASIPPRPLPPASALKPRPAAPEAKRPVLG